MKWLKIVTKSGRQALARELLAGALTPDAVADYAVKAANKALGMLSDKKKLEKVAGNVETASSLVARFSAAIKDGTVTPDEAAGISADVAELVSGLLTPEVAGTIADKVAACVP